MIIEGWFPAQLQVGLNGLITNDSTRLAKANFGGVAPIPLMKFIL